MNDMNKQTEFILKWKSGVQIKYLDFFLEFFHWLKAKRHEDDLVKTNTRVENIALQCYPEKSPNDFKRYFKGYFICADRCSMKVFIAVQNKNKQTKRQNKKNREKQEKTKNVRSST
jgi:hypothetical protein